MKGFGFMDKSDIQRIQHIKRYCEDIAQFIERFGNDFQLFVTDQAYYNAVSMCILQIGELANGLSQEFRNATCDSVHWHLVRGMRNWIAHAYNEVEDEVVWGTVKKDIPNLLHFCVDIIEKK
jgi:uncharacterized protein with HEPN domain